MTMLIVLGVTFAVFVLALGALHKVQGNCAGRCEESPDCDFCPGRPADDVLSGGAR
jgi:hypothetical protein